MYVFSRTVHRGVWLTIICHDHKNIDRFINLVVLESILHNQLAIYLHVISRSPDPMHN